MMTLYPPLETGENHGLQHGAEVRFRLEKEPESQCIKSTLAKPILRTELTPRFRWSALAWRLLSTIIAAPVAIGIEAGTIVCGLLGAGGNLLAGGFKRKLKNTIRSVPWLSRSYTHLQTAFQPP